MGKRLVWAGSAALVAGVLLTGCGGPQLAGTAAIVGDDVVPLAQVQQQLDHAAGHPGLNVPTPDLARELVGLAVTHDLLARRAAAEGIRVSDTQVDARIAELGGEPALLASTAFDRPALRQRVHDELISIALAEKAMGGLSVKADVVGTSSRAEAEAVAHTLLAGGPAADALFSDPRSSRRDVEFNAATMSEGGGTVVFGTPVGGVVAFKPNPQDGTWVVFKVVDRRTDGAFDPKVVNAVSTTQKAQIGTQLLQPDAQRIGIRVNPRYGVWDPVLLAVVPDERQASMLLAPAAPTAG